MDSLAVVTTGSDDSPCVIDTDCPWTDPNEQVQREGNVKFRRKDIRVSRDTSLPQFFIKPGSNVEPHTRGLYGLLR